MVIEIIINSVYDSATSCKNLVKSVTPEITRLELVQQASSSTGVSLTGFAMGRHC